jgi:hypothetical protein
MPSPVKVIAGMATTGVLLAANAVASPAPPHGELSATIRTAGMPCAQVIEVKTAGEDRWSVRCNAGDYTVERDSEGKLKASR